MFLPMLRYPGGYTIYLICLVGKIAGGPITPSHLLPHHHPHPPYTSKPKINYSAPTLGLRNFRSHLPFTSKIKFHISINEERKNFGGYKNGYRPQNIGENIMDKNSMEDYFNKLKSNISDEALPVDENNFDSLLLNLLENMQKAISNNTKSVEITIQLNNLILNILENHRHCGICGKVYMDDKKRCKCQND